MEETEVKKEVKKGCGGGKQVFKKKGSGGAKPGQKQQSSNVNDYFDSDIPGLRHLTFAATF